MGCGMSSHVPFYNLYSIWQHWRKWVGSIFSLRLKLSFLKPLQGNPVLLLFPFISSEQQSSLHCRINPQRKTESSNAFSLAYSSTFCQIPKKINARWHDYSLALSWLLIIKQYLLKDSDRKPHTCLEAGHGGEILSRSFLQLPSHLGPATPLAVLFCYHLQKNRTDIWHEKKAFQL